MYSDDKDFELKVQFQKILWSMGLWSRIDIPVVIYEEDKTRAKLKKHFLTDIDVYGESIQPDFSLVKNIGDCKSGNVKVFERLFWIRGVKDYINADQAYLVKKNLSEKAKLFMPKVNVKGIDEKAIKEYVNIYHTSNLHLFSREYYNRRDEIISQLSNEYQKIYDYLNTRYWFTDSNTSQRVLMTMLQKNNFYNTFKKDNKAHRFLLLEICILLARTLIDCCNYVVSRDVINIEQSVLEYIHGGIDNYTARMQMIKEISNSLKELLGPDGIENSVLVKPNYFMELLKLIAVLVGEASNIRDVTRYMEIMQHEIILEKNIDYTNITGLNYSAVGHKLAKDIISFYLKTNNIDPDFFSDLFTK